MPRFRVIATCLAAMLVTSVAAGCTAPKEIKSAWPAATLERAVPRPAGTVRWPLTGLPAPSPEAITVRVVAVAIANSSAARPQTGLDKADIVYEIAAQGSSTRFDALFQSQTPSTAGPVSSAWPSDVLVVPQYLSLFAHVGADANVQTQLKNRSLVDDMDQLLISSPYRRDSSRTAPNDLFVSLSKLRQAAIVNRGYEATTTVTGPAFASTSVPATPSVSVLTVPFSSANRVTWTYDPAARTYRRAINGKAHVDRSSKQAITARNVVVLWALTQTYPASDVASQVVDAQLTGTGRMTVFRDGQRFDGTWTASATAAPVLHDSAGKVVPLAVGNTWFEVIANDKNISMK